MVRLNTQKLDNREEQSKIPNAFKSSMPEHSFFNVRALF